MKLFAFFSFLWSFLFAILVAQEAQNYQKSFENVFAGTPRSMIPAYQKEQNLYSFCKMLKFTSFQNDMIQFLQEGLMQRLFTLSQNFINFSFASESLQAKSDRNSAKNWTPRF